MFDNFQQVNRFFADRKQFGIKPGLDRMYSLLWLLGQPQTELSMIHVAGTNGKGSTIHYLYHALHASGYQVGAFTSPSLHGLTGYIWLNHTVIPDHLFINILNEIYPSIQKLDEADNHPTEFEIITALAFVYFAGRVDIALIETGMGGREDTTNCFLPLFSIITNVEKDHTAFLGDTIEAIAGHKAGIIKPKKPVILGDMMSEALAVIRLETERNETDVYQFGSDFWVSSTNESPHAIIWSEKEKQKKFKLKMKGGHQLHNASLSLMALSLLEKNQYRIDWKRAVKGIEQTQVPGRFEKITDHPPIVIDGAHNVAGIQSFIQTMLQYYPDDKRCLLFAGFQDKALTHMLQELTPYFSSIMLTSFDHPRAIKADALYQLADYHDTFTVHGDWHDIVKEQMKNKADDAVLFVTGSLNFIFEVRRYLSSNFFL